MVWPRPSAGMRSGAVRMRCAIWPTMALLGAVLIAACSGVETTATPMVKGSGNLVTRDLRLTDFSEVQASGPLRVDVTRGEAFRVSVTADDNAIELLRVERQGRALSLDLKPGSYSNLTLRVAVVMPDLTRLQLGGASTGTISGFKPASLDLKLLGASQLTGRLEAGAVNLTVAEASRATLGGAAETVDVVASGAGHANLGDLAARSGRASLKEASTAILNLEDRLDADLRSASTLYYVGNPSLGTVSSVEGAVVRRR